MRKPVILLNMAVDIHNKRECDILISQYATRVSDAGAVPMLMPSIENEENMRIMLSMADGVLLIGGKDYHPRYYGCEPQKETALDRMRPHCDITFCKLVLETSLPVLGICGGCQLLNIVTGGRLIQHLPEAEKHTGGAFHPAVITGEGFFARALKKNKGDTLTVNSFHHQAVDPEHLGDGFHVTATAYDGSVEVIEGTSSRMLLGVQFHPERMDDIGPGFFELLAEEAKSR